jgi:hypothetical protein
MLFSEIFSENRAVYKIMWRNLVETDYWMTLRIREDTGN